jgi:hypothetical protein
MSIILDEAQLEWIMKKAENPTKRLLKIYFSQFDSATIKDWCRLNSIDQSVVPQVYHEHAEHIKNTKRPTPEDVLLTYPAKPDSLKYQHRAAGWIIYLDIVPASVEWDDEMVSNDIKRTMSHMFKSVEIILELLKPKFPDLLNTLTISMDDKNLTLQLKDSRFPDMQFPSRIGFVIEKIYM